MRSRKRYVLMEAEGELEDRDLETFDRYFRDRGVRLALIRLRGHGAALIAKTDVEGAAEIREECPQLVLGGKRLRTELVSGCIGKLKRRAADATAS